MRRVAVISAGVAAMLALGAAAAPKNDPPPAWAFFQYTDDEIAAPPDTAVTVPGSKLHMTIKALGNMFKAPDWFPADHPAMPDAVQYGHAPKLWACAVCHRPTGSGDAASAAVTGLDAAYIAQQFAEFRSGRRQCAVSKRVPCGTDMLIVARAATNADIKAAAVYFSHLPYHSPFHVVEAAMVPKTRMAGFQLALVKGGGTEPIRQRILEVPANHDLAAEGDWRDPYTVYVPPGSIARGKALVDSGAGGAPCAACHGAGLKGVGMVPPLAGRWPSYIARQLYDIQYGFRRGPAVAPMLPEVAHMTASERIDIAAYLASLDHEHPVQARKRTAMHRAKG